ncbi:hypothetical protein EG329_003811 [Mollisiaceae sp. DMI_Dod_QoI]|nr:hypothetical protein EG329_003811 [Helotiales sp. DMI_Dod_QoI]
MFPVEPASNLKLSDLLGIPDRAFYETDIYSVTSESSPDGSRRRVDHVVKRYDPNHHTFTALLWIECKRPTGSVLEVENQALDAALRCILADDLLWIYTVTTVGLSFRTWIVPHGARALQPLHGTAVVADRHQYIRADTDGAYELTKTIDLVKTQTPLRQAPVVPSQSVEDYPVEDYSVEEYAVDSYVEENSEQQGSSSYVAAEAEPPYDDGTAENADGRGAGRYVQVNVTRINHSFRADEYIFKDSRNHRKSTTKDEWEQIQYNGDWVWAYRGRRTTYISRRLG